jgi:hypothetical protein
MNAVRCVRLAPCSSSGLRADWRNELPVNGFDRDLAGQRVNVKSPRIRSSSAAGTS